MLITAALQLLAWQLDTTQSCIRFYM